MTASESTASPAPPTGVVTIIFTDIVGSTALRQIFVAQFGEVEGDQKYRERVLDLHNAKIRPILAKHGGYEVKTNGDSFIAAFATPSNAVGCAAAIQRSFRDNPVSNGGERLTVRIGMHTGQPALFKSGEGWDYDGHAVNIAARVEALLKGGEQILCSAATEALAGHLPGIRYHDCGDYSLKGIADSIKVAEVLWSDDQTARPPPREEDALPYPWLTEWIGRGNEIDELRQALRTRKLVTLRGIGGVGKTRLAVETLLANRPEMPREIVFVQLAECSNDQDAFLSAVRSSLQLAEAQAPDIDALRKTITNRDLMLVLDNFESVMAAAELLPGFASLRGVRLLVTSQQSLLVGGEAVVPLEPMPTDGRLEELESFRLFSQIARMRDAQWVPESKDAMSAVLGMTDGLPYLIEILAARASLRTLREMYAELQARLGVVRSRAPDASRPIRHDGVQACLEWATSHLPVGAGAALAKTSVFAGGFTRDAARTICSVTDEALDDLVDASLLRRDRVSGRYSMLRTTRAFARGKLADESDQIANKHATYFVQLLDSADDALRMAGAERQMSARLAISTEIDNVREAVRWAETRDVGLFRRAVPAFSQYLTERGKFVERFRLCESLAGRIDERDFPQGWATTQNNLGNAYADLPTGERAENLQKAIGCYEATLRVWTERNFPQYWATTQNNVGNAYAKLPTGERAENLNKAIGCYEAALRVRTEREFPQDWAMTQNNLGNAYAGLPTGERAENLQNAIDCYEAALRIRTEREFPQDWAMTQNNLGAAYAGLPTGERAENLQKAIGCYEAALRVWTERNFPQNWATTQNNVGNAYANLPTGERAENLQNAIDCYEAALRIRTEREFPQDWAMTQNNLGNAYADLPTGERAENLQKAIGCYEATLRVWTERNFPQYWATTQNNVGNAYAKLPTGERAENLNKAIGCYEAALRVRTERNFPQNWAGTQNNLGNAYAKLPTGKRAENLKKAIDCFEAAARGYAAIGLEGEARSASERAERLKRE